MTPDENGPNLNTAVGAVEYQTTISKEIENMTVLFGISLLGLLPRNKFFIPDLKRPKCTQALITTCDINFQLKADELFLPLSSESFEVFHEKTRDCWTEQFWILGHDLAAFRLFKNDSMHTEVVEC